MMLTSLSGGAMPFGCSKRLSKTENTQTASIPLMSVPDRYTKQSLASVSAQPMFGFYSDATERHRSMPALKFGLHSWETESRRWMSRFESKPDFERFQSLMKALNQKEDYFQSIFNFDPSSEKERNKVLTQAVMKFIQTIDITDPRVIREVDRIFAQGYIYIPDEMAKAVEEKMTKAFPKGLVPFSRLNKEEYRSLKVYSPLTEYRRMAINWERDPDARPLKDLCKLSKDPLTAKLFTAHHEENNAHSVLWHEKLEPLESALLRYIDSLSKCKSDEEARRKLQGLDDAFAYAKFSVSEKLARKMEEVLTDFNIEPHHTGRKITYDYDYCTVDNIHVTE